MLNIRRFYWTVNNKQTTKFLISQVNLEQLESIQKKLLSLINPYQPTSYNNTQLIYDEVKKLSDSIEQIKKSNKNI